MTVKLLHDRDCLCWISSSACKMSIQYKIMQSVIRAVSLGCFLIGMSGGCSLDSIVNVSKAEIGSEVDHAYLETKSGALGLLYDSRGSLQDAVSGLSYQISSFTDEMTIVPWGTSGHVSEAEQRIDTRVETVTANGNRGIELSAYASLQKTRATASQARYFLRRLGDTSLNYAISATFALEAYAITLLAENLCSGVPLSESTYGVDVFYSPGLSTDSLFNMAVAKFDSALAIPHDSIRYRTLASIGKGRALISLAKYEDAAEAVSVVLRDDVYQMHYTESPSLGSSGVGHYSSFWTWRDIAYSARAVVNLEGVNGTVWYGNSWIDPRVPVDLDQEAGMSPSAIVRQTKFSDGNVTLNFAGWQEAKMIQAEYLLSKSDPNWIDPLNEARRSIGLADTISQPDKSSNVDLLFRERAFWFYGEGVRLSDYRRLVRQYGRAVNSVYPIGPYTYSLNIYGYGDAVVFTPPFSEINNNYNYSGCINKHP